MTTSQDDPLDPLDRAVSDRLARLRTMPVELSALRNAVDAQIGAHAHHAARPMVLRMFTPMRAVAASLLVGVLVIALIIASSAEPVLASADRLAQLHQDVISDDRHGTYGRKAVNSIEAANRALTSEDPGAPLVPTMGDEHVKSCCVRTIGRKRISCVSMVTDGARVSMAVANAPDVRMPTAKRITTDGETYYVQSARGVNMVMTVRAGRWVCLMGEVPTPRLIDLAKQLKF